MASGWHDVSGDWQATVWGLTKLGRLKWLPWLQKTGTQGEEAMIMPEKEDDILGSKGPVRCNLVGRRGHCRWLGDE